MTHILYFMVNFPLQKLNIRFFPWNFEWLNKKPNLRMQILSPTTTVYPLISHLSKKAFQYPFLPSFT